MTRKTMLVVVATAALLAIIAMPTFASSDPHNFRIAAVPDRIHSGRSLGILVVIDHGTPSCGYSVVVTVTGPGGVNAKDSFTINTNSAGNGLDLQRFPYGFSGTANTNTPGKYSVSASFACAYTYVTNGASTSFLVLAHHHHRP